MRRLAVICGVAGAALVAVPAALAAPVLPAIPVGSYGDQLLNTLASAVAVVFPYLAAVTAFSIGVGLVRRWIGMRSATSLSGGRSSYGGNGDEHDYMGPADGHEHTDRKCRGCGNWGYTQGSYCEDCWNNGRARP